jgi:hypothetical protein
MQTLKKAVKKLTNSKHPSGPGGKTAAPQLAKKTPPTKKKSAPAAPVKKAGAAKKPAHPAPAHKKAAPAKAAAPAHKAAKAPHKAEAKDKKKPHIVHVRVADKNHEKAGHGEKVTANDKAHHAKKPAQGAAPAVAQAQPAKKSDKSALSPKGVEIKIRKAEAPARKKEELEEETSEAAGAEDVVLTDAEGRRYCRVKDCDQIASVDTYCRYHYLLYWKNIQIRKKILTEGKLERYIEELTARYPDKYLEMLKKDLRSEKDFMAAIQELEIDDSSTDAEYEDEAQSYLEEVRGMGGEATGGREEEDF